MQKESSSPRFFFLDALRGIAAVGVLCHHLYTISVMDKVYEDAFPAFITQIFQWMAHGVEVFFVLSGFVIALSLARNPLTKASIGQFILRRQVRLDPPYWAALVLALAMLFGQRYVPNLVNPPRPSAAAIALNASYLHHVFHLPAEQVVLDVSWTLCLEIQFYLGFILILTLFQRTTTHKWQKSEGQTPPIAPVTVWAMWVSGAACLVLSRFVADTAYFWSTWHFFVLGTLTVWAMTGKIRSFWLWSFLGLFAVAWGTSLFITTAHAPVNSQKPSALFVGALTAWVIWWLGSRGRLDLWGKVKPLQYLGRISYSLYLTHVLILLPIMRGGYKLTGNNVPAAVGWFILAGVVSLVFAHLFHLLIERPSLRWTNALKTGRLPQLLKPKETSPQSPMEQTA